MRHIAIIGSGPAGYYTAEAALKQWGDAVRIDMFDRLPVPFGLIRSGVAPDHQSIKAVSRRYEAVALSDRVRFVGNVAVGSDVSVAELCQLYDAVVLATGAPHDRPLGLPGSDLGNVFGSAAFVGWYNGHPHFAKLDPICRATPPWSSAMATSRWTWPGSSPRPRPNSPEATSSPMRSRRSPRRGSPGS